MNRALRRFLTKKKYISRIKEHLYKIVYKDKCGEWVNPKTWTEVDQNCKWIKMYKHGKLYGRSTMNVLEKHFKVKKLRKESRELEQNAIKTQP